MGIKNHRKACVRHVHRCLTAASAPHDHSHPFVKLQSQFACNGDRNGQLATRQRRLVMSGEATDGRLTRRFPDNIAGN